MNVNPHEPLLLGVLPPNAQDDDPAVVTKKQIHAEIVFAIREGRAEDAEAWTVKLVRRCRGEGAIQ